MVEQSQPLNTGPQDRASSLIRPLSQRYLFVLAAVAALVLIDQAILQPSLVRLNLYAPVINLAGRQRMLSQKVTKDSLALVTITDSRSRQQRREELLRSLEQWSVAHHILIHGDTSIGVKPVEPPIASVIHDVESAFLNIRARAMDIARSDTSLSAPADNQNLATIIDLEPIYLSGMEKVVSMLEASAEVQVAWLRGCGLVAMMTVIMLLAGVYFVVLSPAAQLIRGQVEQLVLSDTRHRQLAEMLSDARDKLERRVAERTTELSTANIALEREMAERQSAELRMRELSTELAHASRVTSLGQLATGLAHEINQPLATVANYASTLELTMERTCPGNDDARHIVGQMKEAALRAGAIVRRMRNFVRRGETLSTPVELNDLVREVSELCRPQLREGSVELTIDCMSESTLVLADPLQIQQVLVNLIQNSIQAMEAYSNERHLVITTRRHEAEVIVSVTDSGPGFRPGGFEHCLQPFFSTKGDGLGMGLAICHSIIQRHQGQIWTEQREEGGAVVGFTLPLFEQT